MASRPPYPMPQVAPAMMRAGVANAMQPARISAASRADVRKGFASKLGLPEDATDQQILNAVSDVVASNKQAREARDSQAAQDDLYERAFGNSAQDAALSRGEEDLYARAFGGNRG